MDRRIIIAIDGFSSCGKSTLAKDVAGRLGYRYIDTGAMYRAVTWFFTEKNVDLKNEEDVLSSLGKINIDFRYDANGKQITLLNERSIENEIRMPEISAKVSQVSSVKKVRDFLVDQQKKLGSQKGIVMDGRDIGTVVFPGAELKIFMTASEEIRVQRRFDELKNLGIDQTFDSVLENIRNRDYLDTHRETSPLRKADDAITLDNTNMTIDEQRDYVLGLAQKIINGRG